MRVRVAIISCAMVASVLAGCASETRDDIAAAATTVDATLVETKSSVQLLRNEVSARLPEIVVKSVLEVTDAPEPCLQPEVDPDGLAQLWRSTSTILVTNSQAARIQTVTDAVAESFEDVGWVAATTVENDLTITTLTKPGALARIELSVSPKSTEHRPAIAIGVVGPCVMTGGTDSDEVKSLVAG